MSTNIEIKENGEILVNGKVYNQETVAKDYEFSEIKAVTWLIQTSKGLPGFKEVVKRTLKKQDEDVLNDFKS